MIIAGLAAQAPCLGNDDPQRGPGAYGCHPGSGNNQHPKVTVAGAQPVTLDISASRGRMQHPRAWGEPGRRPENLALLALSFPRKEPDEILCQMVWPDFVLGNLDERGQWRALGMAGPPARERQLGRRAEDSWRSACPGYHHRP